MTFRMVRYLAPVVSGLMLVTVPRAASAQYLELTEFVDANGAMLDSALAVWRRHHATVPNSYNYSYFTGDNGRRYVTVQMASLGEQATIDSMTSVIGASLPNRASFNQMFYPNYRTANTSTWKAVPELTVNANNYTTTQLQQMTYRRVAIRHIRPGMEAAYVKAYRDLIDADSKLLKSPGATFVYQLVSGSGGPAYMTVTYFSGSAAYWNYVDERTTKRAACNGCTADPQSRFSAAVREIENMSLTKILPISFSR